MFMMFSNRKSINPSRLLKKLLEKECGAECAEMGSEEDIVGANSPVLLVFCFVSLSRSECMIYV